MKSQSNPEIEPLLDDYDSSDDENNVEVSEEIQTENNDEQPDIIANEDHDEIMMMTLSTTHIHNTLQTHQQNNISQMKINKKELGKIIRASLPGLLIGIVYGGIANAFLDKNTSPYLNPLLTSTGMMMLSSLSRFLDVELSQGVQTKPVTIAKMMLPHFRGLIFGIVDFSNRATLVHEGGHAIACDVLFNGKPKITMNAALFGGGAYTSCNTTAPTDVASHMTKEDNYALLGGAGSAVELIWGIGSLIVAQTLAKKHPEIATHIRIAAWLSILNDVMYSLTAYSFIGTTFNVGCKELKGNDYCAIQDDGIPPYSMALLLLGSMLLLQILLSCCTKLCDKKKPHNVEEDERIKIEEITDDVIENNQDVPRNSPPR